MEVSWQHIISLQRFDSGPNGVAPGIKRTKLSTEHIYLNPRSRMNVSLAAQVCAIIN